MGKIDGVTGPLLFQDFLLDCSRGGLFRRDRGGKDIPVPLSSRALDLLYVLLTKPGELIPKRDLMEAVWRGTVVEDANLTVQISALRRVLDAGGAEGSCIQTVPGRGYRFVGTVSSENGRPAPIAVDANDDETSRSASDRDVESKAFFAPKCRGDDSSQKHRSSIFFLLFVVVLGSAALLAAFRLNPAPPQLSLVVLPFTNLSEDPNDGYLADGITDDLTTDLSHIPSAIVIAHATALTYKGKARDMRDIGHELNVRYLLEGSVRRVNGRLMVNVQLVSAETGAHLWSDRFDEEVSDLALGQEQVVTRIRSNLGISMIEIEKARSLRERSTNPAAFDLILRARSIRNLPASRQRNEEAFSLYQRALALDPSSVEALVGVTFFLVDKNSASGVWDSFESLRLAEQALQRARDLAPQSEQVLAVTLYWFRSTERCSEAIELAQQFIARFPNNVAGYSTLSQCYVVTGRSEEAIAVVQEAIRRNPRDPYLDIRYRTMGWACVMLGRDAEAIEYLRRALALNPDDDGTRAGKYLLLAAAYARSGHLQEARSALEEDRRLVPYLSARSYRPSPSGIPANATYSAQLREFQDGLRIAGLKDHADEDADFGVVPDGQLHSAILGLTPISAPGATTVSTSELERVLMDSHPIVLDTLWNSLGLSIPGAIGLKYAALGGNFTDEAQARLSQKLQQLTRGDHQKPIIAVGWSSERFDARNLALRIVALGYQRVLWYRGGREAWEVHGLPETAVAVEDW